MQSVREDGSVIPCCNPSMIHALVVGGLLLFAATSASAVVCVVPDNGGTADMPPQGCPGGYQSPDDVHKIINGLPPGTTILVDASHDKFFNVTSGPGGGLGGEFERFNSCLFMQMTGTGGLAGFNRFVNICNTMCETHIGPRMVGDPVQSFPTDFFAMQGQLPPGDPDFDLLRITAGTAFGMPSPGHTTLTQQGGGWAVDSFFDIEYRIDFVGRPGGPLGGMSGSTTGTIRMAIGSQACCTENGCFDLPVQSCLDLCGAPQGPGTDCSTVICSLPDCGASCDGSGCNGGICFGPEACTPRCANYNPATGQSTIIACGCQNPEQCHIVVPTPPAGRGSGNPCVVTDNGGGTVTLPPAGCDYLTADEVHKIIDGLPAGTTIELAPIHKDFICHKQGTINPVCSFPAPIPGVDCDEPGGTQGGEKECAESTLSFNATCVGGCPGGLAGYNRQIDIPVGFETHVGPRTPGQPVQSFDTDMFRLFGDITGDPDFDLLRVTGGTDFGLPSPGHTTLTQLPGGNWAVDSFFDICYRIDFVGRPGGPFGGMSGSTTRCIRMATGGGPRCEGICPPGTTCREIRTPKADGTVDVCCVCEAPPVCCHPGGPGGPPVECDNCQAPGGIPQPPGSMCSTGFQACCLPDGSCLNVDPLCCDDAGGILHPPGSDCANVTCPQPCEKNAPISIDLTTGVDDNGGGFIPVGSPDDTWTVTCEVTPNGPLPRPAEVVNPHPSWQTLPGSQWISANYFGPNGEYCYKSCFCLNDGFQNAMLTISARADDGGDLYLNNVLLTPVAIFSLPATTFTTSNQALFRVGENCIEMRVHNIGGAPTGFNLVGQLTADNAQCCPCPALPDGSGCADIACPGPVPPTDRCEPRCVHYNPFTGERDVLACDCRNPNECHVAMGPPPGGGARGSGDPCVVPDNGSGTVTLPPAGCDYLSPDDVHMIIDGLPAGTTIVLGTIHRDFICNRQPGAVTVCSHPLDVDCDEPGGTLGGQQECADSTLELAISCTGPCPAPIGGLNRAINLPISFETHVGPRTPGNPVQSFDTDMFRMFGQIVNPGSGDPDFDLLRIVGGTDFGLPSPGHTTLTQLPGGQWAVDSFFDITYRIDFVGAPGGRLAGRSGSTTGTIRMATGGPHCEGGCPPGTQCREERVVNADGSIDLCCDCVQPPEEACCLPTGCVMLDPTECQQAGGVPQGPGTSCTAPVACCLPDGNCIDVDPLCCDDLGGTSDPTGSCANVSCPQPACEPTSDGSACRDFACPGPAFEQCQPRCARFNPLTGETQVVECDCRNPEECHVVFPVPPGGARGSGNACTVPDNGSGTVTLPPAGCEYLTADEVHKIIDGLPAGTTIELAPIHRDFICNRNAGAPTVCSFPPLVDCDEPGGSLGGEKECSDSTLALNLSCVGTCPGGLAGYARMVQMPMGFETHTAPRIPGQPVQSFDTRMMRLQGQLPPGDPDFDLLRITGGNDFGMPSPGHTTLTQLPGGNWAVDSFFDITYRIDFVGAPGGPFAGMSGSTTATIRMATGGGPRCEGICPPGTTCHEERNVDAAGNVTVCCDCIPCPDIIAARSHRPPCDLPIELVPGLPITTEPRRLTPTNAAGGITRVIFTYGGPAPAIVPIVEQDCTCPSPPAFGPYGGAAPTCVPVGNELHCGFNPPLPAPCTYQFRLCAGGGVFPVQVRALIGDVGGVGGPDGNGRTDATDRSIVVGAWTGPGWTCRTDLNMDGATNSLDRSIVVASWTGGANCAP